MKVHARLACSGARSRLKAGAPSPRLTGIAGFPAGSAPTRLDAASAASGPTKGHMRSSARRRGMGNRPAPVPQIARRGHRTPGARSRLKAGAPSPSRLGASAARCRVGGVWADKRAHAVVRPAARHGQPPGSRAADRAPGASNPRRAKPAESRRSQSVPARGAGQIAVARADESSAERRSGQARRDRDRNRSRLGSISISIAISIATGTTLGRT